MTTPIGSKAWITAQYSLNSGGIDYKRLKKPWLEQQARIPNHAKVVEVTISKEARQLFDAMVEARQSKGEDNG